MVLAVETGIAPSVWALEEPEAIRTALDYLEARAEAARKRG